MNHAHPTLADPARPLVETKPAEARTDSPQQSRPAIGDIFISPRLIDSVAFREYAQQLRSLIDDAEHAAQSLRTGVTDAITTRRELDRARHEQVERLQAAGKVLRALAAVTKTPPAVPPPATDTVAGVAPASPAAPVARVDAAQAVSAPTVEPERSESPAITLETIDRAIAAAERRLALTARTAEREIERRAAGVLRALDERALEIDARIAALARAEQSATEAASRADAAMSKISEQGRSLAALHERVREAVASLESSSRPAPAPAPAAAEPETPRLNAAMIEKGAGLARDLTSLLDQSERVRRDVSTFLLEASTMLDELHTRRRSLAGAVRDAVLACDKAEKIAGRTRINAAEE